MVDRHEGEDHAEACKRQMREDGEKNEEADAQGFAAWSESGILPACPVRYADCRAGILVRQATSATPQQVTAMPATESALGITPNIASSSATAKIGVR